MELQLKIVVPELALEIENEVETVTAMGDAIAERVRRNLAFGRGARGPLRPPKDGGRPLNRTGQLLASIGVVLRQPGRKAFGPQVADASYRWIAVVRALGDRANAEQVRAQVKRRKRRYVKESKRAVEQAYLTGIQSVGVRRLKSGEYKARSRRIRGADNNGALAAILSQPPKDLRSKNGNRAQYIVFERNFEYERAAEDAARRVARWVLKEQRAAA